MSYNLRRSYILLPIVACVILLLGSCRDREKSRSSHVNTYTSSSISILISKNTGSMRRCRSKISQSIGTQDRTGSRWVMGKSGDWCEYKSGALIASWKESHNRSDADRILLFSKNQAFLGYVLPTIVSKKTPNLEYPCVDSNTLVHLRNHVPAFDKLQLCENAVSATHRFEYRLLRAAEGPLPVLSIKPLNNPARTTVLYLFGGPYANPFSGANLSMLSYVSRRRDVRIEIPIYLGIGDILLTDATDLDLAEEQVEYLIRRLTKSGDSVCAIGGSLGGYILAGIDIRGVRRLLVSPLLEAPRDASTRMRSDSRFTNGVARVTEMTLADWRKPNLAPRTARDVSRADAFVRYFGPSADIDLGERLRHRNSSVQIVYGGRDKVIGLHAIPGVRAKLGNSRVRDVGPVEHAAESPENFWAFEASLDKFLDECAGDTRSSRNGAGSQA